MKLNNSIHITSRLCRLSGCIAVAVFILTAIGCSKPQEKSVFINVGEDGWRYNNSLVFAPKFDSIPSDSIITADIALAIRHTNGYEYSNIWLELTYNDQDTVRKDTFNVRLADELGRWYGKGVGVGYQYTDTVMHNAQIDIRRPLRLRHIMRVDTLAGIEQAGVILGVVSF